MLTKATMLGLWWCVCVSIISIGTITGSRAADWQQGQGCRLLKLDVRAPGRTGFTLLSSRDTDINFTNSLLPADAAFNNNLMNGSGVAAGDFDGDGWCDLYFCSIGQTNALYRNLGGWRFENVTAAAGVGLPGLRSTGALFADVDADGDQDLLVATLGSGPHLFLNDGKGRFREVTAEAGLSAHTGSTSMAMADVDRDGDLDLYVANYGAHSILRSGGKAELKRVGDQWVVTGPYANRLRMVDGRLEELGEPDVLYLNDGQGRFKAVPWNSEHFLDENGTPKPEPWDYGLSVQMRDINGDRWPDIYVCNDFQSVDRIWINDGHGRFRALPRLAMRKQSFSAMGVDFGDLDRDGYLDFFVTEMTAREHGRRLREVMGMTPVFPVPGRFENRPEVARNTMFWNRGDDTYSEIAYYAGVAASDWSWQPVFLDVDLDGFEDILVGNGMWFDVQDRDTLNYVRSLGKQTAESARTNLFLYPPFLTPNAAWRNQHDLTFADVSVQWGFNSCQISQGIALADFDHDGDMDVAINCLNGPPLIYRNETAAPRVAVRLEGRKPNGAGIGGLIRVWGGAAPMQMQEILCGGHYLSCDEPMRVFAAGSMTNDLTIEVRWLSGLTSVVRNAQPNRSYVIKEPPPGAPLPDWRPPVARKQPAASLFRDATDLLGHTHHERLFDDYARQPLLMKQLSQLGPGVAWADLNGDGHDELVIGAGKGGSLDVYRNGGTVKFDKLEAAEPWPAPDDLAGMAAWFSASGFPGLVAGLANYETGSASASSLVLCFCDAPSGKARVKAVGDLAALASSVGPLAVADMDADGSLEMFVGGRVVPGSYPQPASSRIYRQVEGTLKLDEANSKTLEDVGMISGAVFGDLDADGYPELVLACEWGPIQVFHNERGLLRDVTEAMALTQYSGWWNSVALADLDEDGRLDIVGGNWGLNTGYRADSEHPLRVYYGDLAALGLTDLIETYYAPEVGAEVPRRTLNALGQAFPALAAHYPTHRSFSAATVKELLSLFPNPARSVTATTLASMVFLNRGASFVGRRLPAEAQLAPVFAVTVADANGDGHEDVFLSQNFFPMRAEWPRLDGGRGLWLRGDGTGNLTPMPGQESGMAVYGDQRGAAVGDFNEDARPDLVVTQNGAATRLFENTGAKPGLRVRLKGTRGNPCGIGAILRIEYGDHSGPSRLVSGGSGYYSQDSLVQVLGTEGPPTRIHVRWPGGRTVAAGIPSGSREIAIDVEGKIETAQTHE